MSKRQEPAGMSRVISCCNAKGGTGKTTVALNLASMFASHFRKKVLAIDLDPQGNLAVGLGIDPRGITKTTFRLLMDDSPDLDQYIQKVKPNLDLIPNALEPNMEAMLSSRRNRERLLDSRLQAVKDREVREEVERFFESLMLDTTIHKNIKLTEAASAGKPIMEYDKKSSGYFDFTRLAKELLDIYDRSRKAEKEGAASRAR